ncbi:MAG TPA: hypothetical protein PJ986_04660 [Gammaproteobacteria bacterium]|nr:hypothetical protein [Gammaproteobacteria bacterium]
MIGDTALTAGFDDDPDAWAKRDAERRRVDALLPRVRAFVYAILLDGYRTNACDFRVLMQNARRAARGLPPFEQHRLLGALAVAALETEVIARKGRGRPPRAAGSLRPRR